MAKTYPGQDGMRGRDVRARAAAIGWETGRWAFPKTGAGKAGFDFSKICNSGEIAGEGNCPIFPELGAGANDWACTQDNVTGLIWEVKVDDPRHLRHMDHTYSWHSTDAASNGGNEGTAGGGTCMGSVCDTQNFVQTVNAKTDNERLCGESDWRLPTEMELHSIVNYGGASPVIDTTYFPNTRSPSTVWFWTSSTTAYNGMIAWAVHFYNGHVDGNYGKNNKFKVRLVRTGQ